MINSITVTNHVNESLYINLRRPEESGFLVYNISGLGPVEASINISEVANSDISLFNSAKLSTRSISIPIIFMWNNEEGKTIEELRLKTYKYFPLKKKVTLRIETDSRICETSGYVERNEPNIFSQQESTVISIMCPDPYLYDADADNMNRLTFGDSEPAFEFPFSNESLINNTIVFSTLVGNHTKNMRYEGDAEVGLKINIEITGRLNQFGIIQIANSATSEIFKMDSSKADDIVGDNPNGRIEICTERGNKYIRYRKTDGTYINILNSVEKNSDWVQVVKGSNFLRYSAETHEELLIVEMESRVVYEGV